MSSCYVLDTAFLFQYLLIKTVKTAQMEGHLSPTQQGGASQTNKCSKTNEVMNAYSIHSEDKKEAVFKRHINDRFITKTSSVHSENKRIKQKKQTKNYEVLHKRIIGPTGIYISVLTKLYVTLKKWLINIQQDF